MTLGDARWIAEAYGWALISDEVTLLDGAVNGVARIQTDIGDFVVRVHRPWTVPGRLTAVHTLQDRLRTFGIPVPPVVATSAGESFVTMPGDPSGPPGADHDCRVGVIRAVPADPGKETRDHADLALSMLAPLHHADLALSMLAPLHHAPATIDPTSAPQPAYAVDVPEALAWLDDTHDGFATCAHHPHFVRAKTVHDTARELIERIRTDRRAGTSPAPAARPRRPWVRQRAGSRRRGRRGPGFRFHGRAPAYLRSRVCA